MKIECTSANPIIEQKQNSEECKVSPYSGVSILDLQVDFLTRSIMEVNCQIVNLLTLNYCVNFMPTYTKSSGICKEFKALSKEFKVGFETNALFRLETKRDIVLRNHSFLGETDNLIATKFWNMMMTIPERELLLELGEKVLFKLSIQIKYVSTICFSLVKKGSKYDLIENKVEKIQDSTRKIFNILKKIYFKILFEKSKFNSNKINLFYEYILLQFRIRIFAITKLIIKDFVEEYYAQTQKDYIWVKNYWLNYYNEKIKFHKENLKKTLTEETDPEKIEAANLGFNRVIKMYEDRKNEDLIKVKYGDLDRIKNCIPLFCDKDIMALEVP